jgi:EAL domain-containing protein (putative c-di-GMP-specific phosphodiesterase class I)
MMMKKILTVAGPEWQTALSGAAGRIRPAPAIEARDAADAVIALASRPHDYRTLALEAAAGGPWLETLLDLTLGDADRTVTLVMLGQTGFARAGRLDTATVLRAPVDQDSLQSALDHAAGGPAGGRGKDVLSHFGAIRVRYQPIIRLDDMRPSSAEILARLQTNSGATMGPEAIVAAMTDSEQSMELTSLILGLALGERVAGRFDELGLCFAANLPLDAMQHPNLLGVIETTRINAGIAPGVIRFELTESHPVTEFERLGAVISGMREAGYGLALDDISPQTPNLDRLLELPFSAVKLDREVTAGAMRASGGAASRQFISRVTAQARRIGRAVVAEGIETQAALERMRELGATHGQGFLFARPLPARALEPWVSHWSSVVSGQR